MNSTHLFYFLFAAGYAMLREAEGKGWKGFYQFLLSFIAFPTVLGADVYKFMTRPAPNYQFVTNIHNHTDGDVTITKL